MVYKFDETKHKAGNFNIEVILYAVDWDKPSKTTEDPLHSGSSVLNSPFPIIEN